MLTLAIAAGSFIAFLAAYHTYGRWIARKVFQLDDTAVVPAEELRDDVDYVPTRKAVLFGHHFTSIAGTGPIVGPAIAVFWGWLPALLWVVFGSIFIGAVHDFGALVISMRSRGQTIGEVAGRLITPRARLLFLLVLFFALSVVLAIFGLVIAVIFDIYPQSVLSVWTAMPLAVGFGLMMRRAEKLPLAIPAVIALAILYLTVWIGVYYCPVELPAALLVNGSSVPAWTVILMAYCFLASVLPVWLLLQPRDFLNSNQLLVALLLLVGGVAVAGFTGEADLAGTAPAIVAAADRPADAPPLFPFLFITIACGACSGFHCLVSSGTSSKQIRCESDAQFVGYGSMLLEGALAVIVILACCAGLGMGIEGPEGTGLLTGADAWRSRYPVDTQWSQFGLPKTVGAFVDGGANFLGAIGIAREFAVGIIAVLVACFAATTLDSATRLQRYIVQELGDTLSIRPLTNKYAATAFAVGLGLMLAMMPGGANQEIGKGGLLLWPLFGATNQMLAGLAFLVVLFYLVRRRRPVWFLSLPVVMMATVPAIALSVQLFGDAGWAWQCRTDTGELVFSKILLVAFGGVILVLQLWMTAEALLLLPKVRGVREDPLPPLPSTATPDAPAC